MSNENQTDNQKSDLESRSVQPISKLWGMDWAYQFLMFTHPAFLLIWSAIAMALAGLSTFIGFQSITNSTTPQGVSSLYTNGGIGVFALPAFLLGIVGALLPMWAVGRLIADAIREGDKS
jgi:hypothetical protein